MRRRGEGRQLRSAVPLDALEDDDEAGVAPDVVDDDDEEDVVVSVDDPVLASGPLLSLVLPAGVELEPPLADCDDDRESVMYQPLPLKTMPTG